MKSHWSLRIALLGVLFLLGLCAAPSAGVARVLLGNTPREHTPGEHTPGTVPCTPVHPCTPQCIVRPAARAESIGKSEKILFVDFIQHFGRIPLDKFVSFDGLMHCNNILPARTRLFHFAVPGFVLVFSRL